MSVLGGIPGRDAADDLARLDAAVARQVRNKLNELACNAEVFRHQMLARSLRGLLAAAGRRLPSVVHAGPGKSQDNRSSGGAPQRRVLRQSTSPRAEQRPCYANATEAAPAYRALGFSPGIQSLFAGGLQPLIAVIPAKAGIQRPPRSMPRILKRHSGFPLSRE